MAEVTIADNILAKIQQEAYTNKQATSEHQSLVQHLKNMVLGTDDLKTQFVKAAEEEASAKIEKDKSDQAKAAQDKAAEDVARKQRLESMTKFEQLGNVLKSNASKLGDALKDDFKQITGSMSLIAEAPGVKSVIAIVTAIASTLGQFLLLNIKNSGIFGKTISGLIGVSEDGKLDMTKTLENFKEKLSSFVPFVGQKSSTDEGSSEDKKTPKLKADGSKDMRFNENKSFLTKMNEATQERLAKTGESLKAIGNGIMNPIQTLKKAGTALKSSMISLSGSFMTSAKSLLSGAKRMVFSVASLVGGLIASAATILLSGLTLLAPVILIGLAVAAIIFGAMYLRDKFIENKDFIMAKWEMIKEGFSIAMAGLGIWKDKAVSFISNTFKGIWLSIKSLFASIYSGIENGINAVIRGINVLIPGERYDLDPVDIGAGAMRQKVDEEQAAFEVEKANQAAEFAARESDLADRKANNTMERATTIVQNNANTVNEGSKSTTFMPAGTTPLDTNASNMALAQ